MHSLCVCMCVTEMSLLRTKDINSNYPATCCMQFYAALHLEKNAGELGEGVITCPLFMYLSLVHVPSLPVNRCMLSLIHI